MRLSRYLALLCLLCPAFAFGQGMQIRDVAQKVVNGNIVPALGASVTVCSASGAGIPCTPLASIFTDKALTQTSANPIIIGTSSNSDALGNFNFYVSPTASYVVTITGSGFTGRSGTYQLACPTDVNCAFKNINAVRYVDAANSAGWTGTTVDAWIAAAATDLGANGGTVRLATGAYTVAATILPPSLVTIDCDPSLQAVLTASASLNAPLVHFNGVNHAGITNCKLDGNLSNNANSNDLIRVTSSTHINIDRNWLRNTIGNGIFLRSASAWIDITRNEVEHLGPALPSLGTAITSDNNAAAAIVHVKITENRIHDGSLGIYVQPAVSGTTTYDWEISHNRVYGMSADGMAIFSTNSASVGKTIGLRFEDNDSECHGWPANGTGFDPFCTAGFRQTGAVASSSGSGLDLNSANMEGIVVVGNTLSHNFFEGLDVTPQTITTVTTSNGVLGACAGNCVQKTAGDSFNTNWVANQGVQINGTNYLISSVQSATILTLTTAPGTQTGVAFVGIGIPDASSATAVVTGNTACDNGHGNGNSTGQGFADLAYKVSYSSNFACRNNAPGFVSNKSAFISHNGDVAIGNNLSAAANGNFLAQATLNPSYYNVVTSGNGYGIVWDTQTNNAFASGPNITGSTGAVNNLGTGDSYEVGSNRFGALTFNTAGSYSLNGAAGAGAFALTLPGVNGQLSPLVTQFCGTTTTCSATNTSSTIKVVTGSATLNGATPGLATITGFSPAFTSSSSYVCTVSTQTTVANGKKVTNVSASSITITGAAGDSDVVNYICAGT